ncbi:MAG: protein phosphatase CheZ [Pseudomonadota bacterium]
MSTALQESPVRAAANVEQGAREELIARLGEMTEALQQGDDALFGEHLKNLMSRRENGLFLRIERLTDSLHQAFTTLESDQRWDGIHNELPDTSARLEHVTALTEKAAHRTLDLVEQSQAELQKIAAVAQDIGQSRARVFMAAGQSPALAQIERDLQHAEDSLRNAHGQLRTRLSELAQAQEYQDLSGQLLKRAGRVVRDVENGLAELLSGRPRSQVSAARAANGLEGPAVPGVGSGSADQADADALIAMFM